MHDVVIVGGGIIGGSIAFELAQRNLHVAVLDRQELMREASWAAAGMLSPAPDCPAAIPIVPLGRASLALYPKFIDAVEDASGQRTGYRTGGAVEVIFRGEAERELSTLVALHHGLGLACEALPLEEARNMEPLLGRDARAAALLPDECSIEPRALASATLAAAASAGAALCPGVDVISLAHEGKKCVGVKTSSGEIFHAAQVVHILVGPHNEQIGVRKVTRGFGERLAVAVLVEQLRHLLASDLLFEQRAQDNGRRSGVFQLPRRVDLVAQR